QNVKVNLVLEHEPYCPLDSRYQAVVILEDAVGVKKHHVVPGADALKVPGLHAGYVCSKGSAVKYMARGLQAQRPEDLFCIEMLVEGRKIGFIGLLLQPGSIHLMEEIAAELDHIVQDEKAVRLFQETDLGLG